MDHTPKENLANIILASRHRVNYPHPKEAGKRIVGWVIDEDDAGLSDALFAVEEIVRRATPLGSEFEAIYDDNVEKLCKP